MCSRVKEIMVCLRFVNIGLPNEKMDMTSQIFNFDTSKHAVCWVAYTFYLVPNFKTSKQHIKHDV